MGLGFARRQADTSILLIHFAAILVKRIRQMAPPTVLTS